MVYLVVGQTKSMSHKNISHLGAFFKVKTSDQRCINCITFEMEPNVSSYKKGWEVVTVRWKEKWPNPDGQGVS